MPQQPPPSRFSQAFARRPAVARRGLLPGRRVFTSLAWTAAVILVVTLSVWTAGTLLPGDGGPSEAVAAPRPSAAEEAPATPEETPEPEPTQEETEPERPRERTEEAEPADPGPETRPDPEPEREPGPEPDPDPEPETRPDPDTPRAGEPEEPAIVSGAVYVLHSGPGGCLDMGPGNSDGDNVMQWECNGTPNQAFTVRAHGPDHYTLWAKGLCLDVAAASPDAGANVQMAYCSGVAAQDWRFEPLGDGRYRLVSAVSGHCLDVTGGRPEPGTNVIQWTCTGGTPQVWRPERL
ncbi:RICIN domain-containing protein [Streptomyces sp. DSM 44917]|uniref:RICIN domain-containing protein n=1 Tax=Streptomyces boetiae TaxID=3075541 RepID=A0ABU2LB48_9ACTN|nr:RICIN domain-containing protein [Streptomyces sp. DSM 44917]MDT0308742.1 RICIN domain-containing protein [Streptomyces sp. DSM 44917]